MKREGRAPGDPHGDEAAREVRRRREADDQVPVRPAGPALGITLARTLDQDLEDGADAAPVARDAQTPTLAMPAPKPKL